MRKRQTTPPTPPNPGDPAASRAPLTPPDALTPPVAPATPSLASPAPLAPRTPVVAAAPEVPAHPSTDALSLWLAAEQAGSEEAAEAALAELCHMLPLAAPPAGFADRVVARTAPSAPSAPFAPMAPSARPAPPARYRRAWGWRRWLPAAGLAAAVQALTAPLWLPFLLRGFGAILNASTISKTLLSAVDGITACGRWLADLVTWSHTLLVLLRALVEPLATPPVAVLTVICLLMSTLALHWLHDLIERDRRWVHADPI